MYALFTTVSTYICTYITTQVVASHSWTLPAQIMYVCCGDSIQFEDLDAGVQVFVPAGFSVPPIRL